MAKRSEHCGKMGTYTDTVPMAIRRRVEFIDKCIAHAVAALNAGNVPTVASCCGHGRLPGRIDLEDGRVLVVLAPSEDANKAIALLAAHGYK